MCPLALRQQLGELASGSFVDRGVNVLAFGLPGTEIENAIRDLKYGVGLNHLPSGRFAANGAWLAIQVMAHNLARWTARIGLGEKIVITKTLRRRFFSLHLPKRWPWEDQASRALARLRAISLPA